MIKHFALSDCLLSPLHSFFHKRLADRLMMSDSFFLSFFLFWMEKFIVICLLFFSLDSVNHTLLLSTVCGKKMTLLEILAYFAAICRCSNTRLFYTFFHFISCPPPAGKPSSPNNRYQVSLGSLLDDQYWHHVTMERRGARLDLTVDKSAVYVQMPHPFTHWDHVQVCCFVQWISTIIKTPL